MTNDSATSTEMTLSDIANLFTPRALTEEQADLYQETAAVRGADYYEFHELLFERIRTSREKTHILVVGHGGCGKSTELRMLSLKLRKSGVSVIIIEARDDLDLNNFSYIDIFMLIVERLTEYAKDNENKFKIPTKLIKAFNEALTTKITQEYWESKSEAGMEAGASISASLPFLFSFVSKIAASLKLGSAQREEIRRQIDPKMKEIINALNALLDEINSHSDNKIVIIIDGLEKCQTDNAVKLFSRDISSLSAINTHLILACPINIYRSPVANTLQGYFIRPAMMPMIKTHYPDSLDNPFKYGVDVIKALIGKRVEDSFFDDGIIDEIIKMGGGSLRDTCSLLSDSAFEAYMRGSKTVDQPSFERAMNQFATDVFYRAESKYYPMIKRIFEGERQPRNNSDLAQLLYAGVVFEYNGDGWIDLHPLIRHYIEEHMGVLD